MPKKTVFLSSTGADLGPYRAQVIIDARGHDWFSLDAMEEFGARPHPPVDFCRRRVEAADIFVGLIGHYRGWEPEGDNKLRSITEMEYDWAGDAKKPRLMFVAPDGFQSGKPASDGDEGERQRRFRARVLGTKTESADLRCFGTAHDLSTAVFKALFNYLYDPSEQVVSQQGGAEPGQLDAVAMAGAVIADVAQEENRSGLNLDETEAALTARAQEIESRIAQRKEAEAKDRKDGALTWKRLGALAFLYDTGKAMAAYAKAAALDPEDWEALWYLGQLQARGGYLAEAKQSYETLLARRESIENPYYIHWTYFLLGDVEAALGNRSKALDQYERGLALVQALNARDPNNAEWQRDLSVSYNKIGDISAARGDRDGALKAFNDGLDIAKALAARDPNNAEWQRDLSVSYNKIGDIGAARGDRDGALKAFNDGLDIRKALAARDPNNAEWQTDLVVSAWKLAEAGADNTRGHLVNGLAILKRLDGEGKLTADQKGWIGAFEAALQTPVDDAADAPEAEGKAGRSWKFWRR